MANEINVIDLYNQINTLAKVYHAGYDSQQDFNNKLQSVSIAFLNMFHEWDEEDQSNVDHLLPFRVHETIAASFGGIVNLPEQYAFKEAIHGVYTKNPCGDGEVGIQVTLWPADYFKSNEVALRFRDPISKPSMEDHIFGYTFRNKAIQLFPKELEAIEITYLRYPVPAILVLDYSIVGGEDVLTPNATLSINLEWKQITQEYFKFAMLFLLGIEMKESALINASQVQKIASVFKLKP